MSIQSPFVDAAQVAHFEDLAEHWWNPDGPMRALHAINPIRIRWILEQLPNTSLKLCDIGCGAGLFTEAMADAHHQVTGIDSSKKLIRIAQGHAQHYQRKIQYIQTNLEDFIVEHTHDFDVMTCLEVLEHVPDPARMIAQCAQCCKPGGLLFFSTLNRTYSAWLLGIFAAEHILNLVPKNTHQYDAFIRPSELKRWANQSNLTLQTISGLKFNPINNTAALSHDVKINYMMCFKKSDASQH